MAVIQLEIVTPDKLIFSGAVDQVTVPGSDGYLGILPGHAALLSGLKPGVIRYSQGGSSEMLFCGAGFVEVLPEQVSVLAVKALDPDSIDVEEARQQRSEAEESFRSRPEDYEQVMQAWEEAVARLEAAGAA